MARAIDHAVEILDIEIDDLDLNVSNGFEIRLKKKTHLTSQCYLQYFYYGAVVYLRLKDYERAYDFCKIVRLLFHSFLLSDSLFMY